VGYAPYSDVEKITLEAEYLLNSDKFKEKCKGSGEDIKVMTERLDNKVGITVAAAMVSKYISDADEYINYTNQIKDAVLVKEDKRYIGIITDSNFLKLTSKSKQNLFFLLQKLSSMNVSKFAFFSKSSIFSSIVLFIYSQI